MIYHALAGYSFVAANNMSSILQPLVLATLIGVSSSFSLIAPTPACGALCSAAACGAVPVPYAGSRRSRICMEEGAAAAPAAEAASDFTEDLLEALTTDDEPLADIDEPAQFVKAADGITLEPLAGFGNEQAVAALRAKYQLHENDMGSSQVQIAVLTARIAYMTKHMQDNKKDYASLRGLTAMVTRRRKLLEYLLREDVEEFKRLTGELGIRTKQILKPKMSGARGRREIN